MNTEASALIVSHCYITEQIRQGGSIDGFVLTDPCSRELGRAVAEVYSSRVIIFTPLLYSSNEFLLIG